MHTTNGRPQRGQERGVIFQTTPSKMKNGPEKSALCCFSRCDFPGVRGNRPVATPWRPYHFSPPGGSTPLRLQFFVLDPLGFLFPVDSPHSRQLSSRKRVSRPCSTQSTIQPSGLRGAGDKAAPPTDPTALALFLGLSPHSGGGARLICFSPMSSTVWFRGGIQQILWPSSEEM